MVINKNQLRRSKSVDANELKETIQTLAEKLRRTKQTQWARELEDILDKTTPDNQKLGEAVTVLRRLNNTSLPPMLGMSDSLPKLITDIESFFRPKR